VKIRFGVLADVHVVQDVTRQEAWHNPYDFAGVEDRRDRALRLFESEAADRLLLLGDLAHDGDLPSLRRGLRPGAFASAQLAVGGNHDGGRPTGELARAGPQSLKLPGWRAVSHGPVRLAGLRVARRARVGWASARPPALATWGDAPVLLASHFPVLSREQPLAARGLPYAGDLIDRPALAQALLARQAPTVVACGHLHVRDSAASGPLLQLGFGAMIEPPFEATLLELAVDGGSVEVTRVAHELDEAREARDPRLVPARETWRFEPGRGWASGSAIG
jgi:Calcineurin-like phosphoesterase superfamily domain